MIKQGDTVKVMQIHRSSIWANDPVLLNQYVTVEELQEPLSGLPAMWKGMYFRFAPSGKLLTKQFIAACVVKKVELEQVTICEACGAEDSIQSNGDAGCCMECGTAENYHTIEREV